MFLYQIQPIEFADEEAFDVGAACVHKGCSHVEGYTEGSDHDVIRVFHAISFLLLDLIPQSNFAFIYKLNDVELVKFTYKYLILLFKEWLQAGEEVEHEVAVWLVFPGIET